MLLIVSSTLSLIIVLTSKERILWALFSIGLLVLALDDRFMWHETIKEKMLFKVFDAEPGKMGIIGDLPVIIYSLCGFVILFFLLRLLENTMYRILFISAILLGISSFMFDIFNIEPMIDELLKVSGEAVLTVAMMLLTNERLRGVSF